MVRSNLLEPRASVVIPTLTAGDKLARCLDRLEKQTFEAFDIYIVDNSGEGLAEPLAASPRVTLIRNSENVGFGAAINQAVARSSAEFICTLNDDAYPSPEWLAELVNTCVRSSDVGLCASRIFLGAGRDRLDSEGLAVYGDGTTKQSRHGRPPIAETAPREVLLPSGCAALYRRSLLHALGGFDEDYFLYCEDSDLGLRARQAGWRCLYAPRAVVEHDYSASAGRASALKAYLVERNRLYTVVKVFPVWLWPLVPWYSAWRYLAHARALWKQRGLASEFAASGEKWWRLVLIVVSAHGSALLHVPVLLRKRRAVARSAVLGGSAFRQLLRRHGTTASEIAAQ